MSIRNILSKKDYDLFKKQFPKKSVKDLEKIQKNIIKLYVNTVSITTNIIEKGFTKDFKNINTIEWVSFISKLVPIIENMKNVKIGKDKLDLLISYSIFIIINSLPIDPFTKQLLITIVKEIIPPLTKYIIYTSKRIHPYFKMFRKKIRSSCCKSDKN